MFSNMQGPQGLEQAFKTVKVRAYNRTGSAVAVGEVYAFDLNKSDAASTTIAKSLENLVAVGAANINGILGVVTDLLDGSGADDTIVEVCIFGRCTAYLAADTSLDDGDGLMAVSAQTYLAEAAGAATALITRGIALEDAEATAALKEIFFNGLGALAGGNYGDTS